VPLALPVSSSGGHGRQADSVGRTRLTTADSESDLDRDSVVTVRAGVARPSGRNFNGRTVSAQPNLNRADLAAAGRCSLHLN
jgi:hypothetical protein